MSTPGPRRRQSESRWACSSYGRLRAPPRFNSRRSSPPTTCRSGASCICCTQCATRSKAPAGCCFSRNDACSSCASPTSNVSSSGSTSSESLSTRSPIASCTYPCRAQAPASTQRGWLHERPPTAHQAQPRAGFGARGSRHGSAPITTCRMQCSATH